jgi:hypothetical protein
MLLLNFIVVNVYNKYLMNHFNCLSPLVSEVYYITPADYFNL